MNRKRSKAYEGTPPTPYFFSRPSANPSLMCSISDTLHSGDSSWGDTATVLGDIQEEL